MCVCVYKNLIHFCCMIKYFVESFNFCIQNTFSYSSCVAELNLEINCFVYFSCELVHSAPDFVFLI